MNYLLIGFTISIGWGVGKFVIDIIEEMIFCQLHKSDTYAKVCGKFTSNTSKSETKYYTDTKIGF